MPSQQQVRWSQLRVGLTVLFAAIVLATLIFLMSGSGGLFTKKIQLHAYFENAAGLRVGAPVRLEGVDIGNVTLIVVTNERPLTPVRVAMKISRSYLRFLKQDSVATLATAGVLGETFVDVSSKLAKGAPLQPGDVLKSSETPALQDVVRASQGTLQNVDILVKRLDRIVSAIESGEGSVGKLIYDPTLYDRLNAILTQFQTVANSLSSEKGSIGKLLNDDELYNHLNDTVDRVNGLIDEVQSGSGTTAKLINDPALYNNANATIAKANQLMDDINAGKGALGKFAKDEQFAHKLDNTVTRLSQVMDRLEAGEGTAGKLLRDPSVYNNTDQMLVETRKLLLAIRENPKRYLTIHFKVF